MTEEAVSWLVGVCETEEGRDGAGRGGMERNVEGWRGTNRWVGFREWDLGIIKGRSGTALRDGYL